MYHYLDLSLYTVPILSLSFLEENTKVLKFEHLLLKIVFQKEETTQKIENGTLKKTQGERDSSASRAHVALANAIGCAPGNHSSGPKSELPSLGQCIQL